MDDTQFYLCSIYGPTLRQPPLEGQERTGSQACSKTDCGMQMKTMLVAMPVPAGTGRCPLGGGEGSKGGWNGSREGVLQGRGGWIQTQGENGNGGGGFHCNFFPFLGLEAQHKDQPCWSIRRKIHSPRLMLYFGLTWRHSLLQISLSGRFHYPPSLCFRSARYIVLQVSKTCRLKMYFGLGLNKAWLHFGLRRH